MEDGSEIHLHLMRGNVEVIDVRLLLLMMLNVVV